MSRPYRKLKKLVGVTEKAEQVIEKKGKAQEALPDSQNLKLLQQYAKILIGIVF